MAVFIRQGNNTGGIPLFNVDGIIPTPLIILYATGII